jgi:hypothetical protein
MAKPQLRVLGVRALDQPKKVRLIDGSMVLA